MLGSDDNRTPNHRRQQSSAHQIHTDSTYDDVASHSTVDDTTPQTSSESTSISEIPFEARFKTFVKQKKNKPRELPIEEPEQRSNQGATSQNHQNVQDEDDSADDDNYDEPVGALARNGVSSNATRLQVESEDDDDNDNDDDDEDEEDDEEDEEDAEEGVYDLATGTGQRNNATNGTSENNANNFVGSSNSSCHRSSSSQDSNGNLISMKNQEQLRPLSDHAHNY